jgi:hypothetical protein
VVTELDEAQVRCQVTEQRGLGAADSDRRPVFNEDILDRKRNGWQRDLAVNGGGAGIGRGGRYSAGEVSEDDEEFRSFSWSVYLSG